MTGSLPGLSIPDTRFSASWAVSPTPQRHDPDVRCSTRSRRSAAGSAAECTVFALIERFHEVAGGRVLVDGTDVRG
ncbi:hypothetical protein GCM10027074_62550 [Streptomyces deserti]